MPTQVVVRRSGHAIEVSQLGNVVVEVGAEDDEPGDDKGLDHVDVVHRRPVEHALEEGLGAGAADGLEERGHGERTAGQRRGPLVGAGVHRVEGVATFEETGVLELAERPVCLLRRDLRPVGDVACGGPPLVTRPSNRSRELGVDVADWHAPL